MTKKSDKNERKKLDRYVPQTYEANALAGAMIILVIGLILFALEEGKRRVEAETPDNRPEVRTAFER